MHLVLDYSPHVWAPGKDVDDVYNRVLEEKEETISGERARIFWTESRNVNQRSMPLLLRRVLHFGALPPNPRFPLFADHPRLTIFAECQKREDCSDAEVIFRSVELR
jgi:hypothetical protein